ncbi:MAG: response regulator transcription factor [Acidobacteria bacterium]|nr:response regulator transcription factor [Acidobacteriota bacterium]MBV9480855.1 response regulator transcription factor [Acidobacteriota bacterium]
MSSKAAVARDMPVGIVAESAARRSHLRSLLSGEPGFDVSSLDLRFLASQQSPGVLVVDLSDELQSLPSALGGLKTGMVLLADGVDFHSIVQAFSARPLAILRRNCARRQLLTAIQAVAAGLTAFEPQVAEVLLRAPSETVALEPGEEDLTSRETEVLRMMTAGLTNREIASTLGISEHTVKFHIASIFGKLGTSTRTEAVTEGLRRGLILL